MKIIRAIVVAVSFAALALASCLAQEGWNGTVARVPFAWPNDEARASTITKQQILSLVKSISVARNGVGADEWDDVESYRFVSLSDERLYLIAVTDDSPRKLFQQIEIIHCEGTSCSWSLLHSEPPNDLNKQLVDLDKDGRHQVLTRESVLGGKHEGGDLLYVYGAPDGTVVDESAKHPEFYRSKVLPDLAKEMTEVTPDDLNSNESIDRRRAVLLYAQRDVERRVFGDRTAGLSDALQWEQATDEDIKSLAVDTFDEIASPEADAGLKRMSLSDSPYIRKTALDALGRRAEKAAQ